MTYDYDPVNRMVQVTDWDLSVTAYDYDDADRLVSISRPNLVTSTYGYDASGQLLSLSHAGAGGTLSSFDYAYDGVGNRVAVTETFTSTVAIAYTYDPLYRLTAADSSDLSYFHYAYDAVGNRLSYEVTGGETITYTYDIANRMTSAGGVPYTWDDNGNLLADGENTYEYNSANRLISVTNPQVTLSNVYNGLGDRIQHSVDSVNTTYTLDLAAGLTQVLGDENNTYLYGVSRFAQDDQVGKEYFLGDALGSVRQLTDATGAVTLSNSYEPYGDVMASAGDGTSAYGFTNEWTDSYIKLIFLRSRYYSPETGRFLTKDVWQGDYASPLSLNGWNYVQANPINFVDPSGKFFCVPGCCEEWVNSALVQLSAYGGPFSHFVVNMFDYMDSFFPMFILFISENIGAAPVPYMIMMPKHYLDSSLPPPSDKIALFAHEIVHQTQTTDRYSTWGEAQAYIYSGKIAEELSGEASSLEARIIKIAYDIDSPGFTTRDLHTLCEVRKELLEEKDLLPYRIFPNLINYLIFPQWYTWCEK